MAAPGSLMISTSATRAASQNLRRLAAALAPFHPRPRGFPTGLPFIWDEGTLRNTSILTLQTDIGENRPARGGRGSGRLQ